MRPPVPGFAGGACVRFCLFRLTRNFPALPQQIAVRLKAEPEIFEDAKIPRQPQVSVGGYGAFT
jgi:hypothetical protein